MTDPDPTDAPADLPSVPVDLLDDGLLWLINTSVFHPRGFALAYDPFGQVLLLQGDGMEPWTFRLPDDVLEAKFAAVTSLFDRATHHNWAAGEDGPASR